MKSCARNILLIFGFLMLIILLFIPYKSTHIRYKLDPHSMAYYKITAHKSGYMFVFNYLKHRSENTPLPRNSGPGTDHDIYVLKKNLLLMEMMIIMVLAVIDHFLFCFVPRRRK